MSAEIQPMDAEAGQSSGMLPAADIVRQTTIRVLTERIRLLGIDRSGAYEHYNTQLAHGFPIPSYELAILDLVKRSYPDLDSYHEIGSGLGTLPFMLAHDGFVSVGVERDQRRHLTAMAILQELSKRQPHIAENCQIVGTTFPDAVSDLDVANSMAILTDFVSTRSPQDYVRLCRGLTRYRYVMLDLQRFCDKRESSDQQDQLVAELATYGLVPRAEIIDVGGEGYYRLFESTDPQQRHQAVEPQKLRAQPSSGRPAVELDAKARREPLSPAMQMEVTPSASTALAEQGTRDVAAPFVRRVLLPPMPQRARRRRFGGMLGLSALLMIGIPSILAVVYFGFLASSQYVTTFQFAVRGPSQVAAGRSASTFGPTAMSPDAFVITEYINSPQAISDVSGTVDLREIFSRPVVDFWSRLQPDVTAEGLNAYWTNMVWAHFDLVSGNVSVAVRAFAPDDSLKLARALIASSNEMFRRLNTEAQRDFVRIADENVNRTKRQLLDARQAVLAFREKSGFVDPDKTAQAGSAIVDDLRKQLATMQSQYAAIRSMSPNAPSLPALLSQMTSLEAQIKSMDQAGSTSVRAVSAQVLAQYQTLELERQFAEKQYTDALGLQNQAYLTAQNQQSYLALFVEPRLAQTSLYPDRLRSIATVVLAAAAIWFVGMLITYSVRDHLI